MKTVAIVFFGPISYDRELINLSSYNNEIVQEFSKNNVLYRLFCKDFTPLPHVQHKNVITFSGSLFSRIALLIYKILGRHSRWTKRMFFERAFDLFVKFNIDYNKFDTLLLLRETSPGLCEKARKKGKSVIGIASIYPPKIIKSKIEEAEKKWITEEFSNYTSERRIKIYDKILSLWDKIISLTGSPDTIKLLRQTKHKEKIVFPIHEFGVDRNTFYPISNKEASNRMVFMATTDDTFKKGLFHLLEAWQKVDKSGYEIELLIIGNIGKNLRLGINSFNLEKVKFIGYAKNLQNYYRMADVFISPSIIDMGPRTLKQAMSCGNLVISSLECGASYFIDHQVEGFKYRATDSNKLAEHISWCCNNREQVYKMGKAAYEKSKIFNNTMFAKDIYKIVMD